MCIRLQSEYRLWTRCHQQPKSDIKRDAGSFKPSVRRVRVISWLSTRCDGKKDGKKKRRREEVFVQHLVVWARQEEECQELRKVIKYMSDSQEKLMAMMERKKSLLSKAPEDSRKTIFQEIRELDL